MAAPGSGSFLVVALSLAHWNLSERRERLLALIGVTFAAPPWTLRDVVRVDSDPVPDR